MLAQWATGANTPMQSTGSRVSTPSQALLRCSSASICGTSGGTPAIAGRKFAATATSATMRTQDGGSHGKARVLVRDVGADDAALSGTVLDMAPPVSHVRRPVGSGGQPFWRYASASSGSSHSTASGSVSPGRWTQCVAWAKPFAGSTRSSSGTAPR